QVHTGELDGEPVAITIARPGVARATRNDLALLDSLARPMGAIVPRLDMAAGLREARERALAGLDPEHHAAAHLTAARAARRTDWLRIARANRELSSAEVLVSEHVPGPTLADEPDPAAAGAVVRAFAGTPRAIGIVLADARADQLVFKGGVLHVLGAGASR